MECYKDLDDIRNTFEIFARQTKKLVVANGDNEEIRKINYATKVLFYGFNENNDVVIKNNGKTRSLIKHLLSAKGRAIGVEFRNECLRMDLSLSRRFTTSTSVSPTTDIGFSVDLLGFGGSAKAGPARACRS